MKTYVYNYVDSVSHRYHSGGAVLIITDGNPQIDWTFYRNNQIEQGDEWDEWEKLRETLPKPDLEYECNSPQQGVWVFEDSGCC